MTRHNKPKIFIDGNQGTTGLKICSRLESRDDLELIILDQFNRKDINARKAAISQSDISILCLPDKAAIEAVMLAKNTSAKIIDASTAHRTDPMWAYGFPELSPIHCNLIAKSNRVSVPGCHASGFISIVYPLICLGVAPTDYPFVCHSVTGYSGGGKSMIAEYESPHRADYFSCPRQYALNQTHKHQPEMMVRTGTDFPPVFNPIVGDFYSGMVVSVPLHTRLLNGCFKKSSPRDICNVLEQFYASRNFVSVIPFEDDSKYDQDLQSGFLDATPLVGTNKMEIFVFGNQDRIQIVSRFDNLGKGSSGAAVQCMNIMLGIDEKTGLL